MIKKNKKNDVNKYDLPLNNKASDIPPLDQQTAGQLLNNVFSACDMQPNSIPIDTLESWGNYKRPPFEPLRKAAFIIIILLLFLPFMFFKPSIVAERTNIDGNQSAQYNVEIKTIVPVSLVSASLDGTPVPLKAENSKHYTVELQDNGTLEIVAATINGQTAKRQFKVAHIDSEKPEFIDSYSKDGYVYVLVRDRFSGIDYDNITGLTPVEYDEETGLIKFKVPDKPTPVDIPDKAGNVESLLLSPVN